MDTTTDTIENLFNDTCCEVEMSAADARMVAAHAKMEAFRSVDLTVYDVILINTSAGKDSQCAMHRTVELAREQGVMDRVHVVHCDLGRVEWEGVRELAVRQAAAYGLDCRVVSREQGDLLDQVEFERKAWPAIGIAQFCTSDHKTSQAAKYVTELCGDVREAKGFSRRSTKCHVRVLQVLGLRAQESKRRAEKDPFGTDARRSNGSKTEDIWLPIFDWTTEQVWDCIRSNGLEPHPAYALGMTRLSCCFCVLASLSDLRVSGKANKELLREYVKVERRVGHTFKNGWAIEELWTELYPNEPVEPKVNFYMPPSPSAFGFKAAA